jgi:hypothetical protein
LNATKLERLRWLGLIGHTRGLVTQKLLRLHAKDSIFGGWDGVPHFPKSLLSVEEGPLVSSGSSLMIEGINLEGF